MTERDLEKQLRSAIRDGIDSSAPPWLQAHIQAIPHTTPTTRRGVSWLSLARSRAPSLALISVIVVALSVALGVFAWRNVGTPRPTAPSPATWWGPLRADAADMPVLSPNGAGNWADGRDAAVPGVDISAIHWSVTGQSTWSIGLAGWPPRADALDPDQTIIAYGVVLDTDADRVPDYEFGINNDAAEAGEYRVWITDLATGVRDERVGGPYGFPVEFRHPDEQRPQDAMPGQAWEPSIVFTFLPGARPSGSPAEWQFYVWASVTEDGEVVAGDYGPDVGWLPVNSK